MGDGTMCHECRRYNCICGSDGGRIAALEAENRRLREALEEIAGHTGASLIQALPSDDEIIIGHIRSANEIARAALREDTHA